MVESEQRKNSSVLNYLNQSIQRADEKEKQQYELKIQKENCATWRRKELKYLGKFLANQNVLQPTFEKWKVADFYVKGEYDISCSVSSDWKGGVHQGSDKGFDLAGKILMPSCKLHLRSLACDVKIRAKLTGDSSLFISSRTAVGLDLHSPVVKITNDTSLKGLFAMFGCVDPYTSKYNYYKQVQIPEDSELQPVEKNYKELEITYTDNGDDRVYLTVASFGKYKPIKHFATFCDNFIPYFEPSKVVIGGCGDSLMLKYVHVQQRDRTDNKKPQRDQECCCSVF